VVAADSVLLVGQERGRSRLLWQALRREVRFRRWQLWEVAAPVEDRPTTIRLPKKQIKSDCGICSADCHRNLRPEIQRKRRRSRRQPKSQPLKSRLLKSQTPRSRPLKSRLSRKAEKEYAHAFDPDLVIRVAVR